MSCTCYDIIVGIQKSSIFHKSHTSYWLIKYLNPKLISKELAEPIYVNNKTISDLKVVTGICLVAVNSHMDIHPCGMVYLATWAFMWYSKNMGSNPIATISNLFVAWDPSIMGISIRVEDLEVEV
jgi:hypothetical protein